MKVSVIVAVYKDIEALSLIIDSLRNQTYKNFEVIIAEDGESQEMREYISTIKDLDVKHTTQEDCGVRKSHSQNNGIRASSGEYLIFIDGDCILYSDFIEKHLAISDLKGIVSGRRVNLGPKYSKMLRGKKISSKWLEDNFVKKYFDIAKDAKEEKHTEEGLKIKPFGIIHNLLKRRKKELPLLGCNFSCYKEAMCAINGFDEALGNSAYASDADLQWRFKALGYNLISAKYIANQFHLFHQRKECGFDRGMVEQIEKNKKNSIFKCKQGVDRDI
ncbi:glycosyl transferase family 2 [Halarcobacter ebronensis]|uniref:Glycosyl transferase family 2 n=1 Tax=Halarcobacter ebronensis TaxID=1462615 RepID=A0A4Q0YF43_9BACT|nr:glycosyltransferase [Halarcobacter ebronensis]RXJ69157.1 glycosyl transferase family 2 [Halarcobacter ebronensis]